MINSFLTIRFLITLSLKILGLKTRYFLKTQFIEDSIEFISGVFDELVDFSKVVFGNTNSKNSKIYFASTKFKKGVKLKSINKQKYFHSGISFYNIKFNEELDLSN